MLETGEMSLSSLVAPSLNPGFQHDQPGTYMEVMA